MGLKPDWRILANGENITEKLRPLFQSIGIFDSAGLQSDEMELVLADNPLIELPATGAELDVYLGYDGEVEKMGLYIVDALSLSGPPSKVIIKARASVQAVSESGAGSTRNILPTQKTRSWPVGTTLGDMLNTIASEHGLQAVISDYMATQPLPHTDQLNESDMSLLTRIARVYDAIVKPADGKLILVKQGKSNTATGQALPTINLSLSEISSYSCDITRRTKVGSVIAIWRNLGTGEDEEAVYGSGEPVIRLRHQYPDQTSAISAAKTEFDKRVRGEQQLSIQMPGRPDLIAESKVIVSGVRTGIDGEWVAKTVDQRLSPGGYTCNLSLVVPS